MQSWLARFDRLTQGPSHKWWALLVVQSGILMATIDGSIVNVALPSIMRGFDVGVETVEWVVIAYLLTITLMLLPLGRLADILGRKRVVVSGYGVFTLASALCGLAPTPEALVAFRVLQAVGAACLMANGMAITSAIFPPNERGKALGINGTIVATGTTLGPTIGGGLIQAFGWPSIFLVNLPIGVMAMLLGALILREDRISTPNRVRQRFDFAGALLSAVGLGSLVLLLERASARGGFDDHLVWLAPVSAAALVGFVLVERRVKDPLIDLTLFRLRAFSFGSAAAFLSFVALSSNVFLMPFYLQIVLGKSPLEAGVLLAPFSLTLAVVAPFAGRLSDKVGSRALTTAGLTVNALGLLWLTTLDAGSSYLDVFLRLVMLGIGSGMFQAPNNSAVLGSTPRERLGVAGGFLSAMRNLGMVAGTSVAAALLASGLAAFGGASAIRESADPAAFAAIEASFLHAQRNAYYLAAAIAFVGAILSTLRGSGSTVARPADAPAPRPSPVGAAEIAD